MLDTGLKFCAVMSSAAVVIAFLRDKYSKYPKFSYTKVSDKMSYANSAYPDQTAP